MTLKPNQCPFDSSTFLKLCSTAAGVYLMYNADAEIIYIGKARNLKKRLASYFQKTITNKKTLNLVQQITDIQVTVTATENDALLLESNLIKKHLPRYNILLRDDKSYPYLHFSTDESFPGLTFYRGRKAKKGRTFGPYPNGYAVRQTLTLLQKLFKLRSCDKSFFQNRSRPCLQYQIKRCAGPCVGLIDADSYALQVKNAMLFLEGKRESIIEIWIKLMDAASAKQDYEKAALYRDQIKQLRHIQEQHSMHVQAGDADVIGLAQAKYIYCISVVTVRDGRVLGHKAYFPKSPPNSESNEVLTAFLSQYYLAEPRLHTLPHELILPEQATKDEWLIAGLKQAASNRLSVRTRARATRAVWQKLAQRNAEEALNNKLIQKSTIHAQMKELAYLLNMTEHPQRIECFDISHMQGESTVASCVVFDREGANSSHYRRYSIKDITAGDDYAAMTQALTRRYSQSEESLPDIIVIDGGKGQLQRAADTLAQCHLNKVILLSLAKGPARKAGDETVLLYGAKAAIELKDHPAAFLLLQHIRDEAHRFAIQSHRKQRDKKRQQSPLNDIPGIGAKRRKALITHFGGLQEIKKASIQELVKIPGISPALAQRIYDYFQN